MFILRRITNEGVHKNTMLSKGYSLIIREYTPKDFEQMAKAHEDKNELKIIYGFVSVDDGRVIPLYVGQKNYIMTSNGNTFSNVSINKRKEQENAANFPFVTFTKRNLIAAFQQMNKRYLENPKDFKEISNKIGYIESQADEFIEVLVDVVKGIQMGSIKEVEVETIITTKEQIVEAFKSWNNFYLKNPRKLDDIRDLDDFARKETEDFVKILSAWG
jgi:hypothetical protein